MSNLPLIVRAPLPPGSLCCFWRQGQVTRCLFGSLSTASFSRKSSLRIKGRGMAERGITTHLHGTSHGPLRNERDACVLTWKILLRPSEGGKLEQWQMSTVPSATGYVHTWLSWKGTSGKLRWLWMHLGLWGDWCCEKEKCSRPTVF